MTKQHKGKERAGGVVLLNQRCRPPQALCRPGWGCCDSTSATKISRYLPGERLDMHTDAIRETAGKLQLTTIGMTCAAHLMVSWARQSRDATV